MADRYAEMNSIIPGGVPHFLDLEINIEEYSKLRRDFWEFWKKSSSEEDWQPVQLICLELDEDSQEYADRATGAIAIDPSTRDSGRERKLRPEYSINAQKALEPFIGHWVPLPIFVKSGERKDGRPSFDKGPSNWARLLVTEITEPNRDGNTHNLTLVLDTNVEPKAEDGSIQAALSTVDVDEGAEFALAYHERDCGWFVDSDWIEEWIHRLFEDVLRRQKGRQLRDEDFPYRLEHVARYLTFLQLLNNTQVLPRMRLVNPTRTPVTDVDLVLDVGNSRTCGILIEASERQGSLSESYVLELRDLSRPYLRYREPFNSRVEFGLADFGFEDLSRDSGRRAFVWPTVTRVGPEATRLSMLAKGTEGSTGMSSPKRYLWDQWSYSHEWRFNAAATRSDGASSEPPVTRGQFVKYINDQGTPIHCVDDPRVRRDPAFRAQTDSPTLHPVFSRSSLMMFMLSEIFFQALVCINAPRQRADRKKGDFPRRLRRIILTMPTAMPIAERNILRRWAEWAVETLWQSLNWNQWLSEQAGSGENDGQGDYRQAPEVRCDWDEASATQLIFVYNEIMQRFQGDYAYFLKTYGRMRPGYDERESLRVATIDIGGGTTDLMITTYQALGSGATAVIRPNEEFREGFNLAGDDILRDLIEQQIIQSLRETIIQFGVLDPKGALTELLGEDVGGQSERHRNLRTQFANHVALPIALHLLRIYETNYQPGHSERVTRGFRDFFDSESYPPQQIIDFFNDGIVSAGGRGFDLEEVEFQIDLADFDDTIRGTIGQILADLCEVIHQYGCDVLLLSGRPSCFPAIQDAIVAKLPVPPHRVIPMNRYRIGNWYPFRSSHGRIEDPKTTAAVGAMICAMRLDNFSFQSNYLTPKSTARYIGEMELSGEILQDKIFFKDLALDSKDEIEVEHDFEFHAPIFIGFRQLDVDRWTATPFYYLKFATGDAEKNSEGRTPYTVALAFRRQEELEDIGGVRRSATDDRDEGRFEIVNISARDGGVVKKEELTLRLQTLKEAAGYWLDTGSFQIV